MDHESVEVVEFIVECLLGNIEFDPALSTCADATHYVNDVPDVHGIESDHYTIRVKARVVPKLAVLCEQAASQHCRHPEALAESGDIINSCCSNRDDAQDSVLKLGKIDNCRGTFFLFCS